MAIRYLKILLVLCTALMCLLYGLQNIANLQVAHQVVALVLSMADHQSYPNSLLPAITSPILTGLAVAVIIALELAAGVIARTNTCISIASLSALDGFACKAKLRRHSYSTSSYFNAAGGFVQNTHRACLTVLVGCVVGALR